jgi:hypothetical protein
MELQFLRVSLVELTFRFSSKCVAPENATCLMNEVTMSRFSDTDMKEDEASRGLSVASWHELENSFVKNGRAEITFRWFINCEHL